MNLIRNLMTERVIENKEAKNRYKKMVRHLEADAKTIGSILDRYNANAETKEMMEKAGKGGLRKEIISHLNKLTTSLNKG